MVESVAQLIDPAALLLVGGGSLFVATLQSTFSDLFRAAAALRPLFRACPHRDELSARIAVRQVEAIVEQKGIACADRVDADNLFARRAALKLADAPSADAFAEWAAEELEARAARHQAAASVWRAAAEAAPSMGMVGTVIGLIGMFAAMDDPAQMGPAMALAMLTTLYGLIFGTMLFGPAAARLEALSRAELGWQRAALARLEKLARAEDSIPGEWLKRRSETIG